MSCQFYLLGFFICLLCISIPSSESQYNEIIELSTRKTSITTEHNENNELDLTPATKVNCGETQAMVDVCFKDLPPHLMEFLQTTKIALNKEEIASKCTVFKRGMNCFDSYAERCLPKEKVNHFQNNVAAARNFLAKFCDDRKFQTEYLQHKECFYHIQEDWKRCTKDFQKILLDELYGRSHSLNITNKYLQFCCARHAYETCIYNSVRFKCFHNSTKFTANTAKMLAEEKLFSNCRKYENLLCAASRSFTRQNFVFLIIFLMTSIIFLIF